MIVKLNNNLKAEIYNVVERIKILIKISKDKLYLDLNLLFKLANHRLCMYKSFH